MGIFTLKDWRNTSPPKRRDARFIGALGRGSIMIPSEEQFGGMLSLERKRTDRSGKPFLLMLMDIDKALENDSCGSLVQRICLALSTCTRDTDARGWHADQAVLGVLFTEVNLQGPVPVTEVIETKMRSALASQLEAGELSQIGISLHTYPDGWGNADGPPPNFDLYPDLTELHQDQKFSQMLKRAIDVVGSGTALAILSPLLALIALLVRLTSKGPVLFRQSRVGQYGRRFVFLKFRTMYGRTDETLHKKYVQQFIAGKGTSGSTRESEDPVYKIKDDPRVTPIGRILRKTSLDELPQFLNVLRGEMSLVGPRPPIPYEVECYDTWHRRRLLEVKPGITGLWQVCGRSRMKFNDMVRLDLQYAKTWSLWLDLKILFRTPRAVVSGDGAY